jgi:hypothetical protein
VTDEHRSVLADVSFYRDVLGMEVVFETLISGEPFDAVLHATRKQEGRAVGALLGGLMVEVFECFSSRTQTERRWNSSSCPAVCAAPMSCTAACGSRWDLSRD